MVLVCLSKISWSLKLNFVSLEEQFDPIRLIPLDFEAVGLSQIASVAIKEFSTSRDRLILDQ